MALSFPIPPPAQRSSDGIPDSEAIRAVIDGRREMFEIIVRRYNPQLYRIGMAYLRNHAQAEDAMQNTYLKAFLKLARFEGASAFSTWLTRIMINECLILIRSQKSLSALTANSEPDAEPVSPALPTLELLNAKEVKALLERVISTLPRSHRAVYLMREVQQLSTAETASCLGMSEANVKVSLHRARESLKAELLKTAEGMELFEYSAGHCDPMTARVMTAIRALH